MPYKRKQTGITKPNKTKNLSNKTDINYLYIDSDTLSVISLFLDAKSILACRLVSQQWRGVFDTQKFWNAYFPEGLWEFWTSLVDLNFIKDPNPYGNI